MSVAESYRSLALAQKGRARGAPAYSLYVNRPLGRMLASVAHALGLTPNQVTLISGAFTFSAIALLVAVPPSVGLGISIWFLLAIGYAWDSADGQLARLRGGGTLVGEWLDHIVDSAKIVTLHIAVAVGAYRYIESLDIRWMFVPLIFTIVASVTFFGMILNDLLRARIGAPQAAQAGGSSPVRAVLGIPTDYGTWCFVFVLWGWAPGFLVAYSLLAVAAIFYLGAAASSE